MARRRVDGKAIPMSDTVLPAAGRWHQRWQETCGWLALPPVLWPVGERLLARYQEPTRHYHGPGHILALLSHLDNFVGVVRNHDAVEIAIWFHDAIYDPTASGDQNERHSAHLFHRELGDVLRGQLSSDTVETLILATRHEDTRPASSDESLIRDLDLSVLAEPSARYLTYTEDISREYSHLDETTFREGRTQFIKKFLSRKQIYKTRHFRKLWEDQARENLVEELDSLTGR